MKEISNKLKDKKFLYTGLHAILANPVNVCSFSQGSDASTVMIDQWIDLVQQKNALVSEESDLMVA